jgi:hypothetical protein
MALQTNGKKVIKVIGGNGLIRQVLITDQMREIAHKKAKEMGTLRNSISNGDGNVIGFLGELAAWSIIGGKLANTYDYDIVLKDSRTVDVKSKRAKVVPLPYYECSVAAYNIKQKCDFYCFVRVTNEYDKAWVLGMVEKDRFYKMANYVPKGSIDGDNRFEIKDNCYNLKIQELDDAEYIVKCTF